MGEIDARPQELAAVLGGESVRSGSAATAPHAWGSPTCISTVARLTRTAVSSAGSPARAAASSALAIHSRCSVTCPVIAIGMASADIARAARPGRSSSSGTDRAISAKPADACPAWLSRRRPT